MNNLPRDSDSELHVGRPIRRILVGLTAASLIVLFLLWRIDNDRMAAIRASLVDALLPVFEIGARPIEAASGLAEAISNFSNLTSRITELEEDNQRLQELRRLAISLEQQNAILRDLVNLQLNEEFSTIAAEVSVDASGAFRNTVLINVGRQNGIQDGWAVVEGSGLVGRISGVGRTSSRVLLLTDPSSRIPIKILPAGIRGLALGGTGPVPLIGLAGNMRRVAAGNEVYTSGDGGIFPANLLVGTISTDQANRPGIRLAADLGRLEFVSVIRSKPAEAVESSIDLIENPYRGASDPENSR